MLKNQDTVPEPQVSVSQARVTPEELTAALAAIEARRQAEANRLARTIPLDQAVSELHLDSTTDEIWTEVQSHRAKAAEALVRAERQPTLPQPQAVQQVFPAPPRTRNRRRWISVFAPFLLVWILFHNNLMPHFGHHHPPTAAPVLRPLAQIPDGTEVYADDSALAQVSKGELLTQISISENPSGNRWTLVKMGGHVYLRGYIAETDTLTQIQGRALDVYNDDDSGGLDGQKTSNITLRVDKMPLQKSGSDEDYSELTVPNFQPDPLTTLTPGN
ncbi:MAG: hypothetical protein ACRYFS_24010 [Janthinobacterium lividum]